jgi:hypothetical protein
MTAEQFVWWMRGFFDSNPDVNPERIREQLAKVRTSSDPFSFITTTGASKASNTFEIPSPYPTYPPSPLVTFSTVDSK